MTEAAGPREETRREDLSGHRGEPVSRDSGGGIEESKGEEKE